MMERTREYREELGRYSVTDGCQGLGFILGTNETFKFRGVDASYHGFGCIISTHLEAGSTVVLTLAHCRLSFEVMWCESYLGIDHMYRVGLTSTDPQMNVEATLIELGFVEIVTKKAS